MGFRGLHCQAWRRHEYAVRTRPTRNRRHGLDAAFKYGLAVVRSPKARGWGSKARCLKGRAEMSRVSVGE